MNLNGMSSDTHNGVNSLDLILIRLECAGRRDRTRDTLSIEYRARSKTMDFSKYIVVYNITVRRNN